VGKTDDGDDRVPSTEEEDMDGRSFDS